jgi:hypothetical protein
VVAARNRAVELVTGAGTWVGEKLSLQKPVQLAKDKLFSVIEAAKAADPDAGLEMIGGAWQKFAAFPPGEQGPPVYVESLKKFSSIALCVCFQVFISNKGFQSSLLCHLQWLLCSGLQSPQPLRACTPSPTCTTSSWWVCRSLCVQLCFPPQL